MRFRWIGFLTIFALSDFNLAAFGQNAPMMPGSSTSSPSFNCKYAKSNVEKMICVDPKLAALDRKLAETLQNMSGQPSINQKALRAEEDHWLLATRDRCMTKTCIAEAYRKRDAELLAKSAQAASPAVSAETKPIEADPKLVAEAKKIVGGPCNFDMISQGFSGFTVEPHWAPAVILKGFDVVIRRKGASRFAFLFEMPSKANEACRITDFAILPPHGNVMSCSESSFRYVGVGVRLKPSAPWAFWSVDPQLKKLVRQPLGVLGIPATGEKALDCRPPEWGE